MRLLASTLLLIVAMATPVKANEYVNYFNGLISQVSAPNANYRAIVANNFGFSIIGRYVAGRSYRKFTSAQKARYNTAFKAYIVNYTGDRLASFDNIDIKILSSREVHNSVVVKTTTNSIGISWRIQKINGIHKVVDIVISDISMLLTQRREFSSAIRNMGIDKFITALESQS